MSYLLKAPKWLVLNKRSVSTPKTNVNQHRFTTRYEQQASMQQPADSGPGSFQHQPSNTKLKYDRIKLRSRQKHRQTSGNCQGTGVITTSAQRSLSHSSQGLKSDEYDNYDMDMVDDADMMDEAMFADASKTAMKNAKSLGYLTTSSSSSAAAVGCTGDDRDRMRRSLSNYTYLGVGVSSSSTSGHGSLFYRESGSRHSLKPLSVSNGSLNNNWYKPKSLQLPANSQSSLLESALNGPSENSSNSKTGLIFLSIHLIPIWFLFVKSYFIQS